MKKHNLFHKTTTYLLSIGISIFILMGCQNTANNALQANGKNSQGNRPSQEQMKERIQGSIQPLVTAGTITQDQSDKIIAAYSTRPARNQQSKTQDKQQSNQQSNNDNSSQDNNQTSNQNKQRFNPLSDLVTSGVITQAQADAVMEKIKENSPHKNNQQKNNGQNPQNNNGQSSN